MDAEVIETRFHVEHSFWPKISLRAELPWRRVSGGSLDGFIENWHDFFGLPNGSRNRLPRDELLIEYRMADKTLLLVDESASGIGDIPAVDRLPAPRDGQAFDGGLVHREGAGR